MLKKFTLLGVGLAVAVGAIVASGAGPHVTSCFRSVQKTIDDSIPMEARIDSAKEKIKGINTEIRQMVSKVAAEKVQLARLNKKIDNLASNLDVEQTKIIALRDHLKSGETHFVTTGNRKYTTSQVNKDLARRFKNFKIATQQVESLRQVHAARQTAYDAAVSKLNEAKDIRTELSVKINQLEARKRLLDVKLQASNLIDLDNSHTSQTVKEVADLEARLEAKWEEAEMLPQYDDSIPVNIGDEEAEDDAQDIGQAIDAYFSKDLIKG